MQTAYSAQDANTQTYKLMYKYYRKHKGPKINTLVQFKIYKYHKTHKNEILKDQITYGDHILYKIITQNSIPHSSIPSDQYHKFQHSVPESAEDV